MSNIIVEFEVLPADGAQRDEPSAMQVFSEIQHQLSDRNSTLCRGDFGRYALNASLATSGGAAAPGVEGSDAGGISVAMRESPASGSIPRDALHSDGMGSHWGQGQQRQGPYDAASAAGPEAAARYGQGMTYDGAIGLSNSELLDRISHLERGLEKTAGVREVPLGYHSPYDGDGANRHMQQRVDAIERELRDTQERLLAMRGRAEQAELLLGEKEQLLAHAKEMWMKESVRASKLAEALTVAEDQLADAERQLGDTTERYDRAQQELRQLQHLVGSATGVVHHANGAGALSSSSALRQEGNQILNAGEKGFSSNELGGRTVRRSPLEVAPTSFDAFPAEVVLPPPIEPENNIDRFKRLCLINDAVLYEDEILQVGIRAEYSGWHAQLAVYFGNKSSSSLQALTVQYYESSQGHALRLTASPISQQVEPDQQIFQPVGVTMIEPFIEPPLMRIQFLLPDNSPRRIQTRLPVIVTKFMVGQDLNQMEFFRIWRQQNFVLNEVSTIVQFAARFRGSLINIARTVVFGGALRLHHGIDDNQDNLVLVSRLSQPSRENISVSKTGDGSSGPGYVDRPDSFMVLVRVEVGSGRFAGKARIVVRSDSNNLARALCEAIATQLGEAGMPQAGLGNGRH